MDQTPSRSRDHAQLAVGVTEIIEPGTATVEHRALRGSGEDAMDDEDVFGPVLFNYPFSRASGEDARPEPDREPELGKWPRLLVSGRDVTEEQANEVIVRTSCWYMFLNDQQWLRQVMDIVGVPLGGGGLAPDLDSVRNLERKLAVLDLAYLHNDRIGSAWIGGSRGWCDWSGRIAASTYNIGKWPTVDDVTGEWRSIAEAFPFLDLTAQLVADEGAAATPAVEWRVIDGRVGVDLAPDAMIVPVGEVTEEQVIARLMLGGERGVSPRRLDQAVRQVKQARGLPLDFVFDAQNDVELDQPRPTVDHS